MFLLPFAMLSNVNPSGKRFETHSFTYGRKYGPNLYNIDNVNDKTHEKQINLIDYWFLFLRINSFRLQVSSCLCEQNMRI